MNSPIFLWLRPLAAQSALFVLAVLAAATLASAARADDEGVQNDRQILIVSQNEGTEITDLLIPYSVLSQADVGQVRLVALEDAPVQLWPHGQVLPETTIAAFDAAHPDGADVIVLPAVVNPKDEVLLSWVRAQADKGALLVSICDGALILAGAGLLEGRSATAHFYSLDQRVEEFPDVTWVANQRYVDEGRVLTSAGVSASLPISLHLVERLAGAERARTLANQLGTETYGRTHNSDVFQIGVSELATAGWNLVLGWPRDAYDVRLSSGMDEIAFAFTLDMLARTYRTGTVTVASEPVTTAHGLTLLPDATEAAANSPVIGFEEDVDGLHVPSGARAPTALLSHLSETYGEGTAHIVALQLEYPWGRLRGN